MGARITAKHRQLLETAKEINRSLSQDHSSGTNFMITEEAILFSCGFIEFSWSSDKPPIAKFHFIVGFEIELVLSITNALTKSGYIVRVQQFMEWNEDDKPTELVPVRMSHEHSFVDESELVFLCGYKIAEPYRLSSPTAKLYIENFCGDFETANKLAI